ncbi:collagen alpha-5(VI) chain-like [Dendronephthya gigantea]|uniref:collagen alpha-5(VI) chain-like n=1 Tax=Dendronephthya gigantea TaxID=151771 RepID=UPI00106AD32F|nr:collagen alpha-5(VI) chain-like [Dendronephthya gigantea]
MVRDNYTISEPGTHVGIVEYSDEPSIKLRLNETFDENSINNRIDEMRPSEGESANLDKALEKSVDEMFSVELGGRPSAKKILVVIAASNTTAKEALKKAAKPLKERGVRIYVIALDDADPEVLSELVPDKKKIKKVKDKKKLPKLHEEISKLIEEDLIKKRKEKEMVDFVFAFGSTGRDAIILFEKEKDAAKVMIDNEKEKDILYSTIVYGQDATLNSKFNDTSDKAKVKKFIDTLTWKDEGQKLDHALVEIDNVFQNYGRPKARKITVVFVTGEADATTSELKRAAKKLNDNEVKIIVVKLGTDPDDEQLKVITPEKNIVKKKKTVKPKELAGFIEEVVKKDPCAAVDCEHGAKCSAQADDSTLCQCNEKCPTTSDPVCGSNEVSYDNECEMKRDMCLKQKPISVKRKGSCKLVVDLVIALDGSENLAEKGFDKIKDLVKAIIENQTISETETHIGVVEFSDEAHVILPLNELFEPTAIHDKVQRIIPSGGKNRVTDEALRKSADNVFDAKSGGRPGASKVLIIVTDGKSTGKEPPKRAVKPVKEKGVRVYVVNIGEDADKDELKDIVPTEKNIYHVKDSDKVPDIAPKLVEDIEKDIKKRLPKKLVDVIFVMGSADPNGRNTLTKEKIIVNDIIEKPNDAFVTYGVVQLNETDPVKVPLGDYNDEKELKEKVKKLPFKEGKSLDEGIKKAGKELGKNGRPKARKVIVVFVDGNDDVTEEQLKKVAEPLKKKKVKIIPVVLGENVDEEKLKPLLGKKKKPKKEKDLKKLAEEVAEEAFNDQCFAAECKDCAANPDDSTTCDLGEIIDLVFAIEGTTKMKVDGFNEAKDFVKNMVRDNYTISEPGTHVGIVEYSDEPSIKLRLNETFDEISINNKIDEMRPSEGESANLDKALEKSVDEMFSVELGGRPSAKKILVVIAASNTTAKEALKKAAKPLKERGVRIYVIALDNADQKF